MTHRPQLIGPVYMISVSWMGRARVLASFLVGHGLNQIIGLFTGFLLLRWLTIEDYAKFSLALSFQFMMTSLTDIGISGAIVNLVGSRGDDREVIASYINATRWLRNKLFLICIPVGAVAFHYFADRHDWSAKEQITLYGSIVATIFFQAATAAYTSPLIIHRRLAASYRIAAIASLSRLTAAATMYYCGSLSAAVVCVITAGSSILNAYLARSSVGALIVNSSQATSEARKELLKYVAPLAPAVVFFAFQGQITVFIMSAFGSARNVAEVGALGRLGLLFGIISALNGNLIAPYFARMPVTTVARKYIYMVCASILGSALLVMIAYIWPRPLLWLLGPKYQHMQLEAVWTVFSSSLAVVGGALYGINLSRRFVFWWASFLTIGSVVSIQALILIRQTLSSAMAATQFTAATNGVMVAVQLIVAAYGLQQQSRLHFSKHRSSEYTTKQC